MLDRREITERKKVTLPGVTFASLLGIIAVIFGLYTLLKMMGANELSTAIAGTEMTDKGDNARIKYRGKWYEYNDKLTTILVMGIDKEGEIEESSANAKQNEMMGGQADALFLMVLDSEKEKVSIIAINRNSMADVDVFDENGKYLGVQTKQIALQHGYGDGKEESCERQVLTVSRFMGDIPIHSYAALNMEAIPALNDTLGGVKVTVLDELVYPEYGMDMHPGDEVTLRGMQAYWYIRLRHEDEFNSNALRLERQKQYLTTFAAEAKKQATSDIRVAIDLYNTASDYMVTDVDLSGFTYLAGEALGYEFDVDNLYTLQGETVAKDNFEEFYPDEDCKKQLIVNVFYKPEEKNLNKVSGRITTCSA